MASWPSAVEPANRSRQRHPSLPFYYGCIAASYTLIAICGSVVPLNFVWPDQGFFEAAQASVSQGRTNALSLFDAAANVALFVPLGFLWSAAVLYSGSFAARIRRSVALIAAAALLSAIIECLQVGLPARTTSPLDIIAETSGAMLGCALWWAWGARLSIWLAERQAIEPTALQLNWALQIYLGAISTVWLLPLDLTCRPSELSAKFRQGGVLLKPFSEITADRALRMGLALALFVPVGVLLATAGTQSLGRVRTERECRWLIVGLTSLLAAGQLLVFSRRSDILEIAAMAMGMVGGVSLAGGWKTNVRSKLQTRSINLRRSLRLEPSVTRENEHVNIRPQFLTHVYALAVVAAVAWTVWQANVAVPGDFGLTGRRIPNGHPNWGVIAYWAMALSTLLAVPRIPIIGPALFAVLAYGVFHRGHASAEFFRALGGLEIVALLGAFGAWLAPRGNANQLGHLSWVCWLATAYAVWALLSAGKIWFDGRPWDEEVIVQCFRLIDSAAVVWMAALAVNTQRADWSLGLALTVGVLLAGVLVPEAGYRNHVTAGTVAIVLPIAFFALARAPQMALQILLGLAIVKFFGMLNAGESRSAFGGAATGLVVYAALSRYRLGLLLAVAPLAVVISRLTAGSFVADRFRAILSQESGWDTGRVQLWQYAWEVFQQFPVFGMGPGTGPKIVNDVHNSYLAALSETGGVGLALYLIVWLATFVVLGRVIWKNGDRWPGSAGKALLAATAAQLVVGLGYSLHALQLAFLIAGWSVALACIAREHKAGAGTALPSSCELG